MLQRIFGALIFVSSLLIAWAWMEYQQFQEMPLNLPADGLLYQLDQGDTVRQLAVDLKQLGVIDQPLLLRLLARQSGLASRLKAGEYRIPAGTTPIELLELLVAGKVTHYSLTLVEGWTFKQMMAAIDRDPVLLHTLRGATDVQIMQQIGHANEHPEGRFFPDTYHFPKGTSDLDLLRRAYARMRETLEQAWQQRQPELPLKSPYEALILASIVERETGLPEERPQIAGVFIRRLQKRMRLQTDPTVIYGMGERYDGNIRRRDLKQDTPYNTYVHAGLTPTPIAMPGAAAIEAVLHPAEGDALYFVATGNGGHKFSATLEAHNQAVRKYQLKR
ncbi:endolytic transglycosylase MltG [Candidatus Endoriftia persephone]|jgi:UPF0755 protein|uniref:Endolytic murein transglycosylase n=3 Tax=Gammaproteobacteria TaxID=1236 RepID=G2FIE8_9GAMM|nr:endolytic transglycosylase MltG [Candidatus Endoriftia persephone]EGW53419.1 aminodeoxychorismate lyase [endosymbiont of Tevnia jerichonana (vent Tica)]USF89037.1 endolytic transglycosylase MltG [Candidatus Endoriftia persephone]